MYTECPDCQTAFRLTAKILRQAQGRVRCGGCGTTFNALDHLAEEQAGADSSNTQTARAFEEQSRELLETLDELSGGDDVRIEDTGVEWQVIDEEAADDDAGWQVVDDNDVDDDEAPGAAPPGDALRWTFADTPDTAKPPRAAQAALNLDDDDAGELRFDDNTPLPDSFYRPVPEPPTFGRRAEDETRDADQPVDTRQADLELGDEDWEELLDEVRVDDEAAAVATESAVAADDDDETVALADDDEPAGTATPRDAGGDDATLRTGVAGDDDEAGTEEDTDAAAASPDEEIDRELLAAAEAADDDEPGDDDRDDSPLVETIVMEGDTFSDTYSGGDGAEPLPAFELPPPAKDAEPAEPPTARRRALAIAASALLALALAAQLVHANRQSLARLELFDQTLGPLYTALGRPVTPDWDIRGWQFESTSGSADAAGERLTIRSRIANRSDGALPYPVVHVALTDRFDDVIGSRMLAPAEYLAGAGDPGGRVRAGRNFTAVIEVDAPAPEATGFKLNVCYPLPGEALRCAIEDFRN